MVAANFAYLLGAVHLIIIMQTCAPYCAQADCIETEKEYIVGTKNVSWFKAHIICKQSGMELATIESPNEQKQLEAVLRTVDSPNDSDLWGYWTSGVKTESKSQDMMWFVNGNHFIYTKFNPGEPNNSGCSKMGDEDCISIFLRSDNNYFWNDAPCQMKKQYICQSLKCQLFETEICLDEGLLNFNNKSGSGQPDNAGINLSVYEKTYTVGSGTASWIDAHIICQQNGMELASIESEKEEELLERTLNKISHPRIGIGKGYWTSGRRKQNSPGLVWYVNGKPLIYKKFSHGQPDNAGGREHCIEVFKTNQNGYIWNDFNCVSQIGFICQTKNCH